MARAFLIPPHSPPIFCFGDALDILRGARTFQSGEERPLYLECRSFELRERQDVMPIFKLGRVECLVNNEGGKPGEVTLRDQGSVREPDLFGHEKFIRIASPDGDKNNLEAGREPPVFVAVCFFDQNNRPPEFLKKSRRGSNEEY